MKPLSLDESQERAYRSHLASPQVLMNGECFCSNCRAIAGWVEVDALRARLAAVDGVVRAAVAVVVSDRAWNACIDVPGMSLSEWSERSEELNSVLCDALRAQEAAVDAMPADVRKHYSLDAPQ